MKEALYARVEAFLKEFPFVRRYARINWFSERPVVKRIDLDLLDRHCWTAAYGQMWYVRARNTTRFILIAADGSELTEVKQNDFKRIGVRWWNPLTWPKTTVSGETVYEAIKRLTDPDQVTFVVEAEDQAYWPRPSILEEITGPDDGPDFGLKVVLHKIPSGKTFSDWLASIREVAAKELARELQTIDKT